MAQQIFFELSIVIAIATLASIIMKLIRQPLIIGHIITGIILGPFALNLVQSNDTLVAFSQIGIAFLLFIVGLNLNFRALKDVGRLALVIGLCQVAVTFAIGYVLAVFLGFSNSSALYLSTALTFSSTIIVVKLLADKHEIDSLHGKIAIGLLLIQDFIVILILMFHSSLINNGNFQALVISTLLKVVIAVLIVFFMSIYVMPKTLLYIAKSQELLFLFGISWVLTFAVVLNKLGFSIEMGALFAGISLASSPFHLEISSKLKPIRDFFIILFFIFLGAQMLFTVTSGILARIIALAAFVLIGKPLIVMMIMGILGYRKRIGFLTGLSMAQISEFSFILAVLGASYGQLSQETMSIITFVGLISIAGSTYLIMSSGQLYGRFSKYLSVFEKPVARNPDGQGKEGSCEIVLFGYNRIGYSLIKSFKKLKKKFLIVDYNPEVISMLISHGIQYKYGDASDSELLDELKLQNSKLVISTIPQLEINLLLLEKIRPLNRKTIIVMTSHQIDDAFRLYEAGADYVIMPHFLGGEHASALIENFGTNLGKFVKEKVKHIGELNQRRIFGHEHPQHHK